MTLVEILPAVRELPPIEKLRLIRILAEELDAEGAFPLTPGKAYELYTPYESYGAASVLRDALAKDDESQSMLEA